MPRLTKTIYKSQNINTPQRRILILGRADIGKTREATNMITNELLTGSDPGVILMPKGIPQDFDEDKLNNAIIYKAVVLFYDDLPNIFPSTSGGDMAKLATPQDKLKKIIDFCSPKSNQMHFIATARSERLDDLKKFDFKKDLFWSKFEIYEVCQLDKQPEIELIKDLVTIYHIKTDDKTINKIQEINKGYTCESIVIFLQKRRDTQITIDDVNKDFKQIAFDTWHKGTYSPLKQNKPEIEEIYRVMRFLRFQINSAILESTVFVLSENLLHKRMKGIFKRTGRKISNALTFLEQHNAISISEDKIIIPDYQLEKFEKLDIKKQISILIKKVNQLSKNECDAISESLFNLGFLMYKKATFDDVLKLYTQSLIFNSLNPNTYYNRGTTYANDFHDYNNAIKDLTKAIKLTPNYTNAYNNRGLAYFHIREYDKAIADCTKAIEIDPNHSAAYSNRGLTYIEKGEYDKAIADCTKAIEIDPKEANGYNNRGLAYYNKKEYDKAFLDHIKTIEIDPKEATAYLNRGNVYVQKEELNKAIADYTTAIAINQKLDKAYGNRGIAYLNKREFNKAIADCTKAIALNSQFFPGMVVLGRIYMEKGEKEKAKYWYKKSLKHKDKLPDKGDRVIKWLKELESK